MNGCWIPGTPIAVDYWRTLKCPAKIFFLSHMHADHTSGLSSSWKDKIYCSELSAKLLKAKFDIKEELIVPLSTGTSHVVELDSLNSITMTVTLINAHHCPGAVMFLFEGYFGTVLYTGDFRFCKEMLPDLDVLNGKSIDTLYFDNTYNSPEFQFPPRTIAREQIINVIDDYQEAIVVFGMFTLGKEDLLVAIAKYFQTWIVVSQEKMEQIKYLDLPDVFTTDIEAGWIRVEKKMKITNYNVEKWNNEQQTIAILPTALYSSSQIHRTLPNIHAVPYSDHSSYPELLQFVAQVKPRRLIPIVKKGEKYAKSNITDLHKYDALLDKTPVTTFIIPDVFRNDSFSSTSKVVQKSIYNGLKRKHSFGVQFYDSPEKEKMPKQMKLDEIVENRNARNVEECSGKDLENPLKENNFLLSKNGIDESNDRIQGLSIKQPQENFNQLKKPRQHLMQLFAGQSASPMDKSASPADEAICGSQRKDSLQLDILHYFKKESKLPCTTVEVIQGDDESIKNDWLCKETIRNKGCKDISKVKKHSTLELSVTTLKESSIVINEPCSIEPQVEVCTDPPVEDFGEILKTEGSCCNSYSPTQVDEVPLKLFDPSNPNAQDIQHTSTTSSEGEHASTTSSEGEHTSTTSSEEDNSALTSEPLPTIPDSSSNLESCNSTVKKKCIVKTKPSSSTGALQNPDDSLTRTCKTAAPSESCMKISKFCHDRLFYDKCIKELVDSLDVPKEYYSDLFKYKEMPD